MGETLRKRVVVRALLVGMFACVTMTAAINGHYLEAAALSSGLGLIFFNYLVFRWFGRRFLVTSKIHQVGNWRQVPLWMAAAGLVLKSGVSIFFIYYFLIKWHLSPYFFIFGLVIGLLTLTLESITDK